jgi:hypothetical protein
MQAGRSISLHGAAQLVEDEWRWKAFLLQTQEGAVL